MSSECKYEKLNPHDLNNTKKAEVDILFFNRVPKVGSMTMMMLLDKLADLNEFDTAEDKPLKFLKDCLPVDEERNLAETMLYIDTPFSYSHHVNFINFTKFGLPKPIYMNMIREPVERVISWYHYVRTPWYIVDRKVRFPDVPLPQVSWIRKSFADCVTSHDLECTYEQDSIYMGSDHRRQLLFFCGHSREDCVPFNSLKTMQIAKRNVERDYAVVGSWEDTNVTLTVLEHYIPLFFKGATKAFYESKDRLSKTNANTAKPHVPEYIKQIVRRNFTNELEFYHFCKQRLYKQYLALRLNDGNKFV